MYKLSYLMFSFAVLAAAAPGQPPALQTFPTMPQAFEPNRGQAAPAVDFTSHGPGYELSLTPTSAWLQLSPTTKPGHPEQPASVRLRLVGADAGAHGEGLERKAGKSNFFQSNDPKRWLTDIPQFGRVRYRDVYPGIDIAYYGNNQRLEYDFILQPHANPRKIRFAVDGADRIRIDADGDLLLTVGSAEIRERKPSIYQETASGRKLVKGRYTVLARNQIGFELERYDAGRSLVIDPVLVFSTYFGGSGTDVSSGVVLDKSGNIYIAGQTTSANLAGNDIGSPAFTGSDVAAYVAGISPSGTLIFTTIIAGANDMAAALAVALDGNGNIYLAGATSSASFPTVNPLQSFGGGADAFVLELNNAGNALIYSTYLGGSTTDYADGVAVDSSGNTLVAGSTLSTNFPVVNAFQPEPAGGGPFAAKIAPGGASLVYSTYYGGSGFANGLTVDSAGDLVFYGDTEDTNFPVVNALQPSFCGWTPGQPVTNSHGWLAALNPAGVPIYSTYICGSATNDSVRGAAVTSAGNVIVTGQTSSLTFPTTSNAVQAQYGGGTDDAFLTEITPTGALVYSTYVGGSGDDIGRGVVLDQLGNFYITGQTTSSNFPAVNPTQSKPGGGMDAFLTKINAAGSAIVFSTWIGGSGGDVAYGVAVDGLANAYVAGYTDSADLPTLSPLQANYGGGSDDAFLTVISTCGIVLSSPTTTFTAAGGTGSTSITTTTECGWTAVSNSSWITILSSPASGSGTGSVSWSVARNSGSQRMGTLTIAGQTVTVTQSGPTAPTITWPAPAAITYGTALSAVQLDASASVPGTFLYFPPASTVLQIGNAQTLSATFMPTDTTDYSTAAASTTINVLPAPPAASGANLVVTHALTRTGGNVVVQLTIANTGGTAAANVSLTSVKVGSDSATPLPQSIGTIGAGSSAPATVTVPASVGASGAASTMTLSGSYTGGTFSSSARITLP